MVRPTRSSNGTSNAEIAVDRDRARSVFAVRCASWAFGAFGCSIAAIFDVPFAAAASAVCSGIALASAIEVLIAFEVAEDEEPQG